MENIFKDKIFILHYAFFIREIKFCYFLEYVLFKSEILTCFSPYLFRRRIKNVVLDEKYFLFRIL